MCVFVTSASSGTLNALVDGTAEITTSESSAMTLFIMQTVEITLEGFIEGTCCTTELERPQQGQDNEADRGRGGESPIAW